MTEEQAWKHIWKQWSKPVRKVLLYWPDTMVASYSSKDGKIGLCDSVLSLFCDGEITLELKIKMLAKIEQVKASKTAPFCFKWSRGRSGAAARANFARKNG